MSRLRSKLSTSPEPTSDRGLAEGVRVNDNVVLEHPLGEGGMGSVWVARHETLKTKVAVKFIGETLSVDDPAVLARFHREASTAAQIKSPYVVQTFDQGVMSSGIPYIVMELLEGEPLSDRIDRQGGLDLEDTEVIIAQTGKALSAAHAHGFVHRDIKPENIFLTTIAGDLHVKVFDFGIAKQTDIPTLDGITASGQPIGTPEFMSPEQLFKAHEVDHRADLWALSVVAYSCLTGRLPFDAETLPELCRHLLQCKFPKPSEFRPELAPPVDDWFAKALHADVDERFGSAKEMAVAFVRAMAASRICEEANALEALFITSDGMLPPSLDEPSSPAPSSAPKPPRVATRESAPTTSGRSSALWLGIPLVLLGGLAALIFRPELNDLFRVEDAARASEAAPLATTAESAPTTAPSASAAAPSAPELASAVVAPEPSPVRPTEIEGKDADTWRSVLRGAVLRSNGLLAAEAFVALATIAPKRFDEPKVALDGAAAAHLATSVSEAVGEPVFEVLQDDGFGYHAADVMYGITSHHGGSIAAKKAQKLLEQEDLLNRATPAMRVALAVRDASCRSRPALFERAATDGDQRTLYLLLAMRGANCDQISCCMKGNARLDETIKTIRSRLGDTR